MKTILTMILLVFTMIFQSISIETQLIQPAQLDALQSDSLTGFNAFTNIVIFIRFNDEEDYSAPFDTNYYEDMFNQLGDISVRDYYLEASYGNLDIFSLIFTDSQDHIIFYTDIYDRSYYEPYSSQNTNGYDIDDTNEQAKREHALLGRAVNFIDDLNIIDDTIDLDVNNDGDIDSLTFMISGEDNGWSSLLWPHQWYLYTDYYTVNAPSINGYKAYTYTFNLLGDDQNYTYKASVGILAHETFHLLGAPDLYHYYSHDYVDNAGPWSLMDNNREVPVHMLGYMKEAYGGWIDHVVTITQSGTYTLEPLRDSPNNIYKIDTGYSNEFVYFEFRYKEGRYESTLPSSGLLVYRVDKDFYGNQDGYSITSNGPGINEVFVFRPYIKDIDEPITFPTNSNDSQYDGRIEDAALSQFNDFDEANTTSSFLMFHSDGRIMNIQVTNVTINGKTISFDVNFEKVIQASLEVGGYTLTPDDYLLDHPNLTYEGILNNVDAYDVYYRLDGQEATNLDTRYIDSFSFNGLNETIHLAYYENGLKVGSQIIEFPFVSLIESNHFPYGNYTYLAWYIPYVENLDAMTLMFNNQFELEEDYDYLYVTTFTQELSFTGRSLRNQELDLSDLNEGIWIEFISDETEDNFYGFSATLQVSLIQEIIPADYVRLNGLEVIEVLYGDTYEELGIEIDDPYDQTWTVLMTSNVNTLISGTYTVIYDLVFNNDIIYTLTRDVRVLEPIDISFNTIDNLFIELGEEPIDFMSLVSHVTFNGDSYDILIEETIDYSKTGSYDVIVTVKDFFDFESSQTLTVFIIDTTAPLLSLVPHVDTIVLGDSYEIPSVTVNELDAYRIDIEHDIDVSLIGRYQIQYKVTDQSGNESMIVRIMHIIENTSFELIIEEAVTTFYIGEVVTLPNCVVSNVDDVMCNHDADVSRIQQIGTHPIMFSYTHQNITVTKVWYVFVIATEQQENVLWIPKKVGDFS